MDDSHGGITALKWTVAVGLAYLVVSPRGRAIVAVWIGERIWRSPGPKVG